jgi:hypothetical protein
MTNSPLTSCVWCVVLLCLLTIYVGNEPSSSSHIFPQVQVIKAERSTFSKSKSFENNNEPSSVTSVVMLPNNNQKVVQNASNADKSPNTLPRKGSTTRGKKRVGAPPAAARRPPKKRSVPIGPMQIKMIKRTNTSDHITHVGTLPTAVSPVPVASSSNRRPKTIHRETTSTSSTTTTTSSVKKSTYQDPTKPLAKLVNGILPQYQPIKDSPLLEVASYHMGNDNFKTTRKKVHTDPIANIPPPSSTSTTATPYKKPNFLLFLFDDSGYADLGINNNNKASSSSSSSSSTSATPFLDDLATKSLRLTDFYVISSICTPSRAGLLTGRYGARTGVLKHIPPFSSGGLTESETTIASYLKRGG